MTPVALTLDGFLAWRDGRTLRFEPGRVHVLRGPNGSGKSAVIDAITFALFGRHRGGVNLAELVHFHHDELEVMLEFDLRTDRHRITRRVQRVRTGAHGNQQVEAFIHDVWQSIAGTERKAGFDAWIAEHVAPNYESFCAATLVGAGPRLLDATPRQRAQLLGDLAGLAPIRELHAAALREVDTSAAVVDGFATLADSDEISVTTAELQQLQAEVVERDAAVRQHANELERFIALETQHAMQIQQQEQRRTLVQRLTDLQAMRAEEQRILADAAHLEDLQAILPAAQSLLAIRQRIIDGEARVKRWQDDRTRRERERQELLSERKSHAAHRDDLARQLIDADRSTSQRAVRVRELNIAMQSWTALDYKHDLLHKLNAELAAMPAGLAQELNRLEQRQSELLAVGQWLPQAMRLAATRADLLNTRQLLAHSESELVRIRREGERAKMDHVRIEKDVQAAAQELATAERALLAADLRRQQSAEALTAFTIATDDTTCRACGQPLTPEHRERELRERRIALHKAEASHRDTDSFYATAAARHDALRISYQSATVTLEKLRHDYNAANTRRDRLVKDIAQAESDITAFEAARPTGLPDDIEALRQQFAQLAEVKQRLKTVQSQRDSQQRLVNERAALTRDIHHISGSLPPREAVTVELQQALALNGGDGGRSLRAQIELCERELDRLDRAAHTALAEIADAVTRMNAEMAKLADWQARWQRALAEQSESHRGRLEHLTAEDVAVWSASAKALQDANALKRREELAAARGAMAALEEQLARLPAFEVRAGESLGDTVTAARQQLAQAQALAVDARERLAVRESRHAQHARQDARQRIAQDALATARRRADVLGPDRLQTHILRDMEVELVRTANAILTETSADGLQLHVSEPGTAEAALAIVTTTTATADGRIDPAFLSTGQRVRIEYAFTVALARITRNGMIVMDSIHGELDPLHQHLITTHFQQQATPQRVCIELRNDSASTELGTLRLEF